jgi:pimeloyl-ACP methyl ester carboxylesterase
MHRSGAGESLVLLHGLGSSSVSWRPILGRLSARHTVVAVDLPGFGDSPALPQGQRPTPEALADAVEQALNDAQLDSAHFCGNSLGGWVALELARRGRARSVVAISPAGFWNERERRYALASLKLAHRQAQLVDRVADAAMALPPLRIALFAQVRSLPWRLTRSDAVDEVHMQARVPEFPETRDVTLDGRRAEGVEEIQCPVLVLWGTRDLLLAPRQAARVTRAIPGSALRMLPGLGHIPMSDDPGTVADAILGFTARAAA